MKVNIKLEEITSIINHTAMMIMIKKIMMILSNKFYMIVVTMTMITTIIMIMMNMIIMIIIDHIEVNRESNQIRKQERILNNLNNQNSLK